MAYELRANSVEGEYYCGDLPGNLQYSKDAAALLAMNTRDLVPTDRDAQWSPENCTAANRDRLMPHTKKPAEWRLIMVMKKTLDDGSVALKGALQNKTTGAIALMTTFNRREAILERGHRAIESGAEGWFVGHYRMGAPPIFWRALQDVLAQQ